MLQRMHKLATHQKCHLQDRVFTCNLLMPNLCNAQYLFYFLFITHAATHAQVSYPSKMPLTRQSIKSRIQLKREYRVEKVSVYTKSECRVKKASVALKKQR